MGFGDSLWGQFDVVKQNCQTGEKRIKAVQQLLKKSQKEEASYADTLSKASTAFVVVGGKSLCSSVEHLRSKLQEEQASRSQFASQLEEEVQKLKAYDKTYVKTSHQLSQRTSRDQSYYDSKLALLNKMKKDYYNCCANEEQLQEALTNPNLEPKKQESLNQQLEKAKENKAQAQDQYAQTVNDHDRVYEDHIVACRDTLNQYEELEKVLCTTLEAALTTYASRRTAISASLVSYSSSISDSVKTIDVANDLADFVQKNSKLLVPGPSPQYEEFQGGNSKLRRKSTKTMIFAKPKLGSSKKKKGKDDPMVASPPPTRPNQTTESSFSSSSNNVASPPSSPTSPTREDTSPVSSPSFGSEPKSPVIARSAASRAPAPSPQSRAGGPPSPVPPSRLGGPPAPSPLSRSGGPPPPSSPRGGGPPPPSRGGGPPPPSREGGPPPPRKTAGAQEPIHNETDQGSANWKIAVALFPNDGEMEGELFLEEGTVLFVICEDESGWWLGATGSYVGFFPGSYVQYLDDDEQIGCVRAKALEDFVGDCDGDLSLTTGEIVTVQDYKDSWYTGAKKNGEVGIFPCQYVQILTDD